MIIYCVKFRDIYMCELGVICLLKPCLDLVVKIVKCTCHISMGISWECIYSVKSRIGAYWSCTEDGWIIFTSSSMVRKKCGEIVKMEITESSIKIS